MNAPPIETGAEKLGRIGRGLSRLIGYAQSILGRPPGGSMFVDQELTALAAEIEPLRGLMIEGGNPLGEEAQLLVTVLGHRFRARDELRRCKWHLAATVLLLLVTDTLNEVLLQHKALLRPSAD